MNDNVALPATADDPMDLVIKAVKAGIPLDMVKELMALRAKTAYDAAMAAACAEMPVLVKDTQVDYQMKDRAGRVRYKHEDLAAVVEVVAPILGKHGLYHSFEPVTEPNRITVACVITHKLGHCVRGNPLSGPPDTSGSKNSLQAVGSTITYLSRYALKAALGLAAAEDDDAQSAPNVKPPVAGPDPMREPPPPVQLGLTHADIEIIKGEARMAADRGQIAFDAFWKRMNTPAARAILTGMGGELRTRIDAAEEAAAQEESYDPDTGELRNPEPT